MPTFRLVLPWLFLCACCFAAELKIKVVDPDSAGVAGAEVTLLRVADRKPLRVQLTAGDGTLMFAIGDTTAGYGVEVRAAGFAPASADVDEKANGELTIQLHVSAITETVVVTATRSPVVREEAGASVDTLENTQLTTMQPVAAADAVRFLP